MVSTSKKRKGKKKMTDEEERSELFTPGESSSASNPERSSYTPIFKSLPGSIQTKFHAQYEAYMKAKEDKSLNPRQALDFLECLRHVQKYLSERSEQLQRRYAVRKALMVMKNAKNSNIYSLSQEVYGMEKENDNLTIDAITYNIVHDDFKHTSAYKQLLVLYEMRQEAKRSNKMKELEGEVGDISFEDLLAKEKKDSTFWTLSSGKLRTFGI